jgi:hypothetical protein
LARNATRGLFNERFQEYLRSIKQTRLMIIILGPGGKSPGYDKRTQIRDHLRSTNKTDDVNFPEEVAVPPDALPDQGHWSKLDFIVASAQVIFALLVDSKDVTGVLSEVTRYGDKRGFREKAFLIIPKKAARARGSHLPQIWAAAEDYPRHRKLRYSDDEFRSCLLIRDYVAAQVDLYRRRLCWDEFMKRAGMTTFEYS